MNAAMMRSPRIAMLLACALTLQCAGALAAQVDPVKRTPEQAAIDAIEEHGGWVDRDPEKQGKPVTSVRFKERIADGDLDLLRLFPHLESLEIMEGAVTDNGLARLKMLRALKRLHIRNAAITDDGLAHLKDLHSLESLSLDCPITGTGLVHLAVLRRLEEFSIQNAKFNDAGVRNLQKLDQVTSLLLSRVSITDAGLVNLRGMSHLERLSLDSNPITEVGVVRLAGMPRLRWITITGTAITADGFAEIRQAIPYALVFVPNPKTLSDADAAKALRWRRWSHTAYGAAGALAFIACFRWQRIRLCARRAWPRWWKAAAVASWMLAIAAGLVWFAPEMMPVREGQAAEFWLSACQIDGANGHSSQWGRAMIPRDGWFIYGVQGFHGQYLYRVTAADALADFPRIVRILDAAPPDALLPEVSEGYRNWIRKDPERSDATALLIAIRDARLVRMHKEDVGWFQRSLARERAFDARWQRIQRYHLNIVFEFVYLSFLVVFVSWPWLRNAGRWRWALHSGLAPILFFLPFWLGYAQLSFTSAGPCGGVLYPWLLVHCHRLSDWNSFDRAAMRWLPQVLEPLSQTLGPMLSLSGFGAVGPTSAMKAGAALGLAVFSWRTAMHWLAGTSRQEPPSHI